MIENAFWIDEKAYLSKPVSPQPSDDTAIAIGDRVRVKPGSDTAELIAGFSLTGVVRGAEGGTLSITLDDGQPVDGTPARNWDIEPA